MLKSDAEQSFPRVQRKTLAQQAAELIADYIEREKLEPGSLLPSEGQLALQFGVSRPILREALRVLETNGAVTVVNGRGAMVKPLTGETLATYFQRASRSRKDAIREVLEVRKGIEVECAALAAQRRSAEQLKRMQSIVGRMRDAGGDRKELTRLDILFHWEIAHASGNTLFVHLVESLRSTLEESFLARLGDSAPAWLEDDVMNHHERICRAIGERDAIAAGQAMAAHIDMGVQQLSL